MKRFYMALASLICLTVLLALPITGKCETHAANDSYISFDRLAIGGVQIRASKDFVRSIYGEPIKIDDYRQYQKYNPNTPDEVWIYKDNFAVYFFNDIVCQVNSEGRNGLKTPDKIQVGDSEAKMIAAYGKGKKLGTRYQYKGEQNCYVLIQVVKGVVETILIKQEIAVQNR